MTDQPLDRATPQFVLEFADGGGWIFTLFSATGEVLFTSENTEHIGDSDLSIDEIRKNAADDARYVRVSRSDPESHVFSFEGVFGHSPWFLTVAERERAIETMKIEAPIAPTLRADGTPFT